jgi:hypothetical protein
VRATVTELVPLPRAEPQAAAPAALAQPVPMPQARPKLQTRPRR